MLSATEDETAALIKKAKTDAERRITYEPDRRPEVANLLRILSLTTGTSPEALAEDIGDGGGGKLKQRVTEALNVYLKPIRARRTELAAQPNYTREVLERGIQRARAVGTQTLDEVRRAMNMRL